jgi:hypothetical protein
MLGASEDEMRRGERRLVALDHNIAHFKFLKAALRSRFPNLVPEPLVARAIANRSRCRRFHA